MRQEFISPQLPKLLPKLIPALLQFLACESDFSLKISPLEPLELLFKISLGLILRFPACVVSSIRWHSSLVIMWWESVHQIGLTPITQNPGTIPETARASSPRRM